jgi:ribosomal protein S18 acetylase RimI-like enzyme
MDLLEQRALTLRDTVLPGDHDAVRAIVEATRFFRPDEVDVAVELVEERLARGMESGYHFIFAEREDMVIGYACYGPIPCTVASYDVYWIAVDPRFQGNGVGRQLMRAVELAIAELGGSRMYVDTSGQDRYAPTRRFYEQCGFRQAARLEDFYAPGDDRVIYCKLAGGV